MDTKKLYYLIAFIGSIIGGYIPILWGVDYFSFASILFSGIGSILGIILVYKIQK